MISWPFLIFIYFLALVVTACVLQAVGRGVLKMAGVTMGDLCLGMLAQGLVGYLVVCTAYALICTRGATISIVYGVLLALTFYEVRRNKTLYAVPLSSAKAPVRHWMHALAGLMLLYAASVYMLYSGDVIPRYSFDYVFYAKIARVIGDSGFENGFNFLNYYDAAYQGVEPYHYFDLWGCSLVSSLFLLNNFLTLQLIIYPLFFWFVFLGYSALLTGLGAWGVRLLVALGLLFVGGLFLPFYEGHPFLAGLTSLKFSLLTPFIVKLAYVYVFLIAAWLLYKNGHLTLSLLCIAGIPIANIVTLPILAGVGAVWCIAAWRKDITSVLFLRGVVYMAVPVIGLLFFYTLHERNELGLAGTEIVNLGKVLSGVDGSLRTRINIVVGSGLQLFILYTPYIVALLLYVFGNKIRISTKVYVVIGVIALATLTGATGWALLYKELNAVQLFSNVSIVLINISVALGVIYVCNASAAGVKKYALISLIIAASLVLWKGSEIIAERPTLHYTSEYLAAVKNAVIERSLRVGVSIKDASILDNVFFKAAAVYPLGEYLTLMNDGISVVNIGDFNTPIDSSSVINAERSRKGIQNGLFYRTVMKVEKNSVPDPSRVEQYQVKFIRDHKIQFVILSAKAVLPKALKADVAHEITDSELGERFVILK